MKLTLNINYRTNWGESVFVSGSIPALGGGNYEAAPRLTLTGTDLWTIEIDLPEDTPEFTYRYFVRHENGYTKNEWGNSRKFTRGNGINRYVVYYRGQAQPWYKPYY